VALGALSKALTMQTGSSGKREVGEHYRHALQYYQRALIGMRTINEVRTALIACLLAFSFESFNDRPDLAVAHIWSGFKLLEQWLKSQPRALKPLVSPVPHLIEDDLLRIFVRMDIHVLTMANAEPKLLAQVVKDNDRMGTYLLGLRTAFASIQEARLFSELLTEKTLVLAHTLLNLQSHSAGTTPDIDMETLYIPGIWAARMRDGIPDPLLEQYKTYLFETHRWFEDYEPLWKRLYEQIAKIMWPRQYFD
jgi:hypothetical protein